MQIFWKPASGAGGVQQLTDAPAANELEIPYSFSSDGQLLTYVRLPSTGGGELWVLHLSDRKAQHIPLHLSSDGAPELSPDGRWLAYVSDDSDDRWQVYVRTFPGPGGLWQVSTDGGSEPHWNPNGRELVYRNGGKMMVVDISTREGFVLSKPRVPVLFMAGKHT